MPLRRAPRHRRPAVRAADHRRPRGRRRRGGGRRRGELAPARRPRRVRLHPVRAVAARAAPPATRTCATSAPCSAAGMQITDGTSRHHAPGHRPRASCACSARSPTTRSSTRPAASRSSTTSRSTRPACSAAASSPAGARRSTPPTCSPGDDGRRRRRRRHRRQRHPGRQARRRQAHLAIDPVEGKREKAMEFGATHTAASIDEALRRSSRTSRGARWPTRSS